ncbi:MAG: hypothetical protein R3D05_21745 [Dongiaceae bacterium]
MQSDQNRDPWEQSGNDSAAGQHSMSVWAALSPFGVVAFGPQARPVERLLIVQGALARGIDLLAFNQSPLPVSVDGRRGIWRTLAGFLTRRSGLPSSKRSPDPAGVGF